MRYGSVCSGVEAASLAWESLGWQPAWFAEIEPFPAAVLNHHWPHVPNHGDMTQLEARILSGEIEAPDILVPFAVPLGPALELTNSSPELSTNSKL